MTYGLSKPLEAVAPAIDRPSKLALAALTLFPAFWERSLQWRQRAADRRYLLELDDHVLADFGLTRQEVIDEAAKPFWQPLDPGSGRP